MRDCHEEDCGSAPMAMAEGRLAPGSSENGRLTMKRKRELATIAGNLAEQILMQTTERERCLLKRLLEPLVTMD